MPNQPYNVWIRAYTTETLFNQCLPLKIVTLPDPEGIRLISSTSKSLTIDWEPYTRAQKYIMACRPVDYDDTHAEIILDSTTPINSTNVQQVGKTLTVLNLHPKTRYAFWLSFWFENRIDTYIWPREERFVFETLPDRPSAPGKPSLSSVKKEVYTVTWSPAEGNGAVIEEYSLEGLRYRSVNRVSRSTNSTEQILTVANSTNSLNIPLTVEDPKPITDDWTVYYSGNDTYWIVKDLVPPPASYSFRVRARNAHGWGEYSALSEPVTEIYALGENREYLVIAVAAPGLVTILIITFSCIICGKCFLFTTASLRLRNSAIPLKYVGFYLEFIEIFICFSAYKRKKCDKKDFHESNTGRIDVELATLQNLPHNGNFVQSNNILYSFGPITDGEITQLPQIRREQIAIAELCLGKGAFGEVYEGYVRNVGNEPEVRVAIKTLHKGATEQEKVEFLQEAQLMSNFKHKHILSLIGVCFDADTLYIIMELMQGGDLLNFLRQSRPYEVSI